MSGSRHGWREDIETLLEPGMVGSMEPMIMLPEGMEGADGYQSSAIAPRPLEAVESKASNSTSVNNKTANMIHAETTSCPTADLRGRLSSGFIGC